MYILYVLEWKGAINYKIYDFYYKDSIAYIMIHDFLYKSIVYSINLYMIFYISLVYI